MIVDIFLDKVSGKVMGEVKAKVKLTNPTDDELVRRGQLAADQIRVYETEAVIDTGAVCSVLPIHVVQCLGLTIRAQRVAGYADGRTEAVGVVGVLIDWQGRDTLEDALVLGDEVLIGQTVLEKLDLLVDCQNQRLIPNPAHPDQPVNKVRCLN